MRTNKKEYQKKWRAENSEKVKEYERKRRAENPERRKESKRKWYAENPEKAKESTRKWKEENPEKNLRYAVKNNLKKQIGGIPPPELIETKFYHIKTKRLCKTLKN